ncbi:MAG TPA: hypothetical protein VFZ22_16630, partial [Pyrinomonadaceae bacterium]|nr:hypothetical protein [Pyrinomonadaceae bacterium]
VVRRELAFRDPLVGKHDLFRMRDQKSAIPPTAVGGTSTPSYEFVCIPYEFHQRQLVDVSLTA